MRLKVEVFGVWRIDPGRPRQQWIEQLTNESCGIISLKQYLLCTASSFFSQPRLALLGSNFQVNYVF
jgi:hypothetical protein